MPGASAACCGRAGGNGSRSMRMSCPRCWRRSCPGLGDIYKHDKPRVKVWPKQVSYQGFATYFHRNTPTGAEEGEQRAGSRSPAESRSARSNHARSGVAKHQAEYDWRAAPSIRMNGRRCCGCGCEIENAGSACSRLAFARRLRTLDANGPITPSAGRAMLT